MKISSNKTKLKALYKSDVYANDTKTHPDTYNKCPLLAYPPPRLREHVNTPRIQSNEFGLVYACVFFSSGEDSCLHIKPTIWSSA